MAAITRYTFGIAHAYAGRFVEITHPEHIDPREVMINIHGSHWAAEYLEDYSDWDAIMGRYFYRCLLRVTVNDDLMIDYAVQPDA